MARVVVAGATGYLGGYVARALKEEGHWVRALTRDAGRLGAPGALVDEVFVGEVTRPETLAGLCEGAEIVFSSIGITRQKDGLTYEEVDYRGNLNLLREAEAQGVAKFMYISALGADALRRLKIADAKERFVADLERSGIDWIVVRPNGYFSDIEAFMTMARRGRAYLFGDGSFRINPIHGADVARFCVDALARSRAECEVGGPVVYTHEEIARLAFAALDKSPRITHLPVAVGRIALALLRAFTSSTFYGPIEFAVTVLSRDLVGPTFGERRLEDFFAELAGR